jgi:hypothetical protein
MINQYWYWGAIYKMDWLEILSSQARSIYANPNYCALDASEGRQDEL